MNKIQIILIATFFIATVIFVSYRFGVKEGYSQDRDKKMKEISQLLEAQGINVEFKKVN